jgi:FkbM family methyltransferase
VSVAVLTFFFCLVPGRSRASQISAYLHRDGHWDGSKSGFLKNILTHYSKISNNKRCLVLDVGANVGSVSLFAASAGYKVMAFEPAPESVLRLWKAVQRNKFEDRVTVFHNAGSDRRDIVRANLNAGNPGASTVSVVAIGVGSRFMGDEPGPAKLDPDRAVAIVLDDLVLNKVIEDPSTILYLKSDAEGGDARILNGAAHILKVGRPPYVSFELGSGANQDIPGCTREEVFSNMLDLGYYVVQNGEAFTTRDEITAMLATHKWASEFYMIQRGSYDPLCNKNCPSK